MPNPPLDRSVSLPTILSRVKAGKKKCDYTHGLVHYGATQNEGTRPLRMWRKDFRKLKSTRSNPLSSFGASNLKSLNRMSS